MHGPFWKKLIYSMLIALLFFSASCSFAELSLTPSSPSRQEKLIVYRMNMKNYFDVLKANATAGDAESQFLLGNYYLNGDRNVGVGRNDSEAVRWYQKSAEQNYAKAQYQLALMYFYRRGVYQSDEEGVQWLSKAASQGNSDAEYFLGLLNNEGLRGVSVNLGQAIQLFTAAAKQDNADAEYELYRIYHHRIKRGRHDYGPRDEGLAQEWLSKATGQGNARAEYSLGMMYQQGDERPQDTSKAMALFTKASDQGLPEALLALGMITYYGMGVPKDEVQGKEWIEKAADRGNATAKKYLTFLNFF